MFFGTKEQLREKASNDKRYAYCRDFLRKKKITQTELAKQLGFSGNSIVSDFMEGRNNNQKLMNFFELN